MKKKGIMMCVACASISLCLYAQEKNEILLKYGDMDSWVIREIKESAIIGGNTKTLYELGPDTFLNDNQVYVNLGGSPWGSSNVMAKVAGITKTNTSVYREPRGNGYCARLETHIEGVKVLGLINIHVLAAGSLFLGDMQEPITTPKGGDKYLNCGIKFSERPKAVRFDYKMKAAQDTARIRMTGFGRKGIVEGRDCATMICLLQRRNEDKDGNITAKRVGTAVVRYDTSTDDWQNNATYKIHYGDISQEAGYVEDIMGLHEDVYYARNSKGESVPIKETGWADKNETPTHVILHFASSHGGAFVGSPGNTLWIDNVRFVYE